MKRSALPRIPRATFEPKINLPTKYSAHDSYDATAGRPPASDFVVSRHIDGAVASRYGEPVWDWTPYNHTGKSSPHVCELVRRTADTITARLGRRDTLVDVCAHLVTSRTAAIICLAPQLPAVAHQDRAICRRERCVD